MGTESEEADFLANDNVGWLNSDDVEIPEDLPKPFLWRVLILPVQAKKVSSGGILIPQASQEAEGHLQFVGRVAAVGPLAFRSFKFAASALDWLRIATGRSVSMAPKIGDWVVYGRFAGQRCEYKGTRLILMNDDELLCETSGSQGFRIHS